MNEWPFEPRDESPDEGNHRFREALDDAFAQAPDMKVMDYPVHTLTKHTLSLIHI